MNEPFSGIKQECAGCGELKDLIFFTKGKSYLHGRKKTCKTCMKNRAAKKNTISRLEYVGKKLNEE